MSDITLVLQAIGRGEDKVSPALLTTTDLTIESIAREVGYQNLLVFSNAFTKSIGLRSSAFRRKRLLATSGLMRAARV